MNNVKTTSTIRNDVVLQKLNVKFIATGVNDYFKFLGPSHCCGKDDVEMMRIIHMDIYDPYVYSEPFDELIKNWICNEGPSYIRV